MFQSKIVSVIDLWTETFEECSNFLAYHRPLLPFFLFFLSMKFSKTRWFWKKRIQLWIYMRRHESVRMHQKSISCLFNRNKYDCAMRHAFVSLQLSELSVGNYCFILSRLYIYPHSKLVTFFCSECLNPICWRMLTKGRSL